MNDSEKYSAADAALCRHIRQELFQRHRINTNQTGHVASADDWHEDRISPALMLTRDEIRCRTGRAKVRDAVMNWYANQLAGGGISVDHSDPEALRLAIEPARASVRGVNEFDTFAELVESNASSMEDDPDCPEYL